MQQQQTPETVKALIGKAIRDHVSNNNGWRNLQEEGVDSGPVCSYSNQKLASTLAQQQGCTQDDVDCRGHWQNTQHISDRYAYLMLEVVDGKVATALCMGGPTKYVYREGSGLMDSFLYDEVCPHIHAKFGGRVAVVLGKSLLWVSKEPVMIPQVPACLRQRVMQSYKGVMQLEEDINPIQKRWLVVYNVGGQLRIDEEGNPVQAGEGQHEANMNNITGGMQTGTAQFAAIHQENIDLRELVTTQYDVMRDELLKLHRGIGRVANRPVMINHGFVNHQGAQPQGGGGGGGGMMTQKTPLCPMRPCYLLVLEVYSTSLVCKDREQLKGLLPKREEELNTSITGEEGGVGYDSEASGQGTQYIHSCWRNRERLW